MEKNIIKTIEETLRAATESKQTLFQVSVTLKMTIADVLDYVDNNAHLKSVYNTYLMTMKDFYLNWAVNERQKDLYTNLMSEIGIIDGESIGNDLELNIIVGESRELKIGSLDDLNREETDEEET